MSGDTLFLPDKSRVFQTGDHKEITGTDYTKSNGNAGRGMDVNIASPLNNSGNLEIPVSLQNPIAAFGELLTAEVTPVVQIDAFAGLSNSLIETFTATGGTVTVKDDHGGREFHCQSGTSVGGYGLIRSKNIIRYRPGQGATIRFSARFGTPVANSAMRAGGVNIGTEISFGYNGTQFGLLHRTAGRPEIQTLTITNPVSGADQTLTLTLNGTEYTITLTAGDEAHNAYEIVADNSFSAAYTVFQNEATVIFIAKAVGPQTNAFTFASSGAATGTFAETANGNAVTDTFINQGDWNITTLTSASDPFILDPSKGNVYEINFQYLGYGAIDYYVENPNNGKFVKVHQIQYANNNVVPSLESPLFKIGWFAASLGSTTNIECFGASAAGLVQGKIGQLKNPNGHSHTKSGITSTLTNIISIRVRRTFNGYQNLDEIFPDLVNFAVDGTKNAVAEVHINSTLGGEPNWIYHDETNQLVEYDTSATTVSGANEVLVIALSKTGSETLDIRKYNIRLTPGDIMTLAVRTTSGTTEATASVTWTED